MRNMRYRCITILCVIIKLPCPGSSFLVIKTRRVTFNVLHVHMGRFKKNNNFLAKVHRANEKNISVIFMELIKKLIIIIIITPSQQVFSYLLSTTRWNSGIHVNECDNYCG